MKRRDSVLEFSLLDVLISSFRSTVRFLHVVSLSFASVSFFDHDIEFLDASFSSLECFVFEYYVYYFRVLHIFPSLRRLLFSTCASFSLHHFNLYI